jgi:hypothetical protein
VAEELTGADRDEAMGIYSRRSENLGARQWTSADVIAPAPMRLYRASASAHFVLDANDRRVPVNAADSAR